MALRNLSDSELALICRLMKEGGRAGRGRDPSGRQRTAGPLYREGFTGTDTADFVGSVRCAATVVGKFTGMALELDVGNRIFTTLPVVPVEEKMFQE